MSTESFTLTNDNKAGQEISSLTSGALTIYVSDKVDTGCSAIFNVCKRIDKVGNITRLNFVQGSSSEHVTLIWDIGEKLTLKYITPPRDEGNREYLVTILTHNESKIQTPPDEIVKPDEPVKE